MTHEILWYERLEFSHGDFRMELRNQLGNPGHPAYDFCLLGIAKRADWNGRLWVRHNQ